MAGNKVKYSDLIQDDGALDRLLDKLEQTATTFEGLVSTAKSSARDISNSLNSMSSATQAGRDSILAANAAVANLKSATAQLKVSISDTSQAVTGLKAAISENTTVTAKSYSAIEQAIGKYDKLKSDLQDYMNLYKSLTTQEKSSPFGQQTLEEITKLASRVNALTANLRALTKTQKERLTIDEQETNSLRKLADAQSDANVKRYENNQALREANRIAALNAKLRNAEPGSYQAISAQYALNKIELSKLNVASETASERTRKLVADTYLLYQQMKQFQEATGVHTLSVGNYTKVWDGLGYSVAQVVREIPNAAIDMRTFFIAISNNIPILADQIMQVRKENEALRAQGEPTVSAIRQVGRALMSWNTILTAVLTVLNLFGDEIIDWIKNLFRGRDAVLSLKSAMKSISKEIENTNDNYGISTANFKELQRQYKELSSEAEKTKWIEKNADALEELWLAIDDVNDADRILIEQADDVVKAYMHRAQAAAAEKLAVETLERTLNKKARLEQKIARKRSRQEGLPNDANSYIQLDYDISELQNRLARIIERGEKDVQVFIDIETEFRKLYSEILKEAENKSGSGSSDGRDLTDRIYKTHLDTAKKYRESETALIKFEYDKQAKAAEDKAATEIAALEETYRKTEDWIKDEEDEYKKLTDEEKRLITESQENIRLTVENIRKKLNEDLEQIELDGRIAVFKVQEEGIQNQLALVKEGSSKELQLRQDLLDLELERALTENAKLEAWQRQKEEDIIKKYEKQKTDLRQGYEIRRLKFSEEVIALQLEAAIKGGESEYKLQKKLLEKQRDLEIAENKLLADNLQQEEEDIFKKYEKAISDLTYNYNDSIIQATIEGYEERLAIVDISNDEGLALERQFRIDILRLQKEREIEQNKQLEKALQRDEKAIEDSYERREQMMKAQWAKDDFMAALQADTINFETGVSAPTGRSRDTRGGRGLFGTSQVSAYQAQVYAKENEIRAIQYQIDHASELGLSVNEVALLNAELIKTNSELDEMTDIWNLIGEKGIGAGILTQLGFDDDQIDALSNATNIVIEQISAIMAAEVEAAEKAVELAQERVDAFQSAYDAEIEARNNGYANNVATAKKELEQEKKNQREKQKLLEQAQKRQEAANSATQASSLVTASAQLWAAMTQGTGILGPALALAAIAAMWTSFGVAKVKAKQVAETYGEGGLEFLEGGSHASGHDIDLGTTNSKGKRMRAEGGEAMAIINKKNTRKYKAMLPDIIDSLNSGNFEEKYLSSLNTSGLAISVNNATVDISRIEGDVADIKKQNETKYYVVDGYLVIQHKNVKRIIKN